MNVIFEKFQKEYLDLRDDHRGSKDKIRIQEITIGEKAAKDEVDNMKKHLDLLPTKEEVIQLRTYMRTNIDKFKDESEQFKS